VFYATSDVWNRHTTSSGAPFANDQPANEDALNGTGSAGDNYAFARIRRNAAAGSGSQTVTAHFLVSKFGTGSNYVDSTSGDPDVTFAADPTLTFNASDVGPLITTGCHWHLNAIASTHLCLAVEISSPNDPYVQPSLVGNTPGWPTTDLRIINDNNKAQRNMGLTTTLADGGGESDCYCAIVHNAAPFRRDFELRYQAATPATARAFESAVIEVIGGEERPFTPQGSINLTGMQPGENRWVALRFPAAAGKEGEILSVNFFEVLQGVVINGFAMGARLGTMEQVVRDKLRRHGSVFGRLAAISGDDGARRSSEEAMKLASDARLDERTYLQFVHAQLAGLDRLLRPLVAPTQDQFRTRAGFDRLTRLLGDGRANAVAMTHGCLLNRIDSFLTMLQLEHGDVADILQNVRWQNRLYRSIRPLADLPCAVDIRGRSEHFIRGYGHRRVHNSDYRDLIGSCLKCFEETARLLNRPLHQYVEEMARNREDLAALQRAHRQFLLGVGG
jgi:hypothetical protein